MKTLWVEIRAWSNCLPVTVMGKTDCTWGHLIYYQSNQIRKMKYQRPLPPKPTLLPGCNLTPDFLCLLPSSNSGVWGMEAAFSSSATPSSPGRHSSHSFPASAWSLSMNFSNVSPSHELQFSMNCSCVGSQGSQTLPGAYSSTGFPVVTGFPLGIHQLWHEVSPTPVKISMSSRGTAPPPWSDCTTGFRGISVPASGETLPLLLHWPWSLQGCVSHTFSALFLDAASVAPFLFPLLKSVFPEALPPLLLDSALASGRSTLELGDIVSVRQG